MGKSVSSGELGQHAAAGDLVLIGQLELLIPVELSLLRFGKELDHNRELDGAGGGNRCVGSEPIADAGVEVLGIEADGAGKILNCGLDTVIDGHGTFGLTGCREGEEERRGNEKTSGERHVGSLSSVGVYV